MSRSLPLLLLLSLSLHAEPSSPAEDAPTPVSQPPAAPATTPPSAEPAKPEPPAPEDKELAAIRSLLESAGFQVRDFRRLELGGMLAMGEVRLAASPDATVREADISLFVWPSSPDGCWRLSFLIRLTETPYLDDADAESLRETLRLVLIRAKTWRAGLVREEDAAESETRPHLLIASRHVASGEPRSLAAFALDLDRDLREALDVGEDGFLVTRPEGEVFSVWYGKQDLAARLRERLESGLPAQPAPAGAATEDPASHASHLLSPRALHRVEALEDPEDILLHLGASALSVPGREALRLALACRDGELRPEASRRLKDLAYDPTTGAPRDAWALYHWARHLIRTLPEEDHAAQVVEALDALRLSARLGCEFALGYYLHLLDCAKEPLVGGESHWEQRLRWDMLWINFSPHDTAEELEVERDYRAGDPSPIRFGSSARGEELEQLRIAVDEMNAARKARGWKTFELVRETPAGEEPDDPAKQKDPAEAGSVAGR